MVGRKVRDGEARTDPGGGGGVQRLYQYPHAQANTTVDISRQALQPDIRSECWLRSELLQQAGLLASSVVSEARSLL